MPRTAPSVCLIAACPHPATYRGRCQAHAATKEQDRYNADTRKWYSSQPWRSLRLSVLADQPVCQDCGISASTECDHIVPHRGNPTLFWDRANLQGLCGVCHGQKTRRGQ